MRCGLLSAPHSPAPPPYVPWGRHRPVLAFLPDLLPVPFVRGLKGGRSRDDRFQSRRLMTRMAVVHSDSIVLWCSAVLWRIVTE